MLTATFRIVGPAPAAPDQKPIGPFHLVAADEGAVAALASDKRPPIPLGATVCGADAEAITDAWPEDWLRDACPACTARTGALSVRGVAMMLVPPPAP